MTSFSDQMSTIRQSQWEAQLDMFRRLGYRALDNTEQLIALNMRTSRESMEQATGTIKQILEVSDPRDLFAIGSNAQGHWQQMFAYGRELLGIATGMRGNWSTLPAFAPAPALAPALAAPLIPAPDVDLPGTPSQLHEQVAIAVADATTVASEIAGAAADVGSAMADATLDAAQAAPAALQGAAQAQTPPQSQPQPQSPPQSQSQPQSQPRVEPALQADKQPDALPTPADAALAFANAASDTAIADDVPPAKAKPLIEALNEVAPKPASVDHPIASTVPLEAEGKVALPVVTPVEHTPPVQAAPAPEGKAPRSSRRK